MRAISVRNRLFVVNWRLTIGGQRVTIVCRQACGPFGDTSDASCWHRRPQEKSVRKGFVMGCCDGKKAKEKDPKEDAEKKKGCCGK